MIGKGILMAVSGMSFGLLSSAGVFTVLVAVGLVPRFAGKTHTSDHVVLYEEMVIFGTLLGGFASIFSGYCEIAAFLQERFPVWEDLWYFAGNLFLVLFGLFGGMFVGCLALAIAEMLDSIPIFARRVSFRHGLGFAVLSMAAGKLCGSLWYFWTGLYRTV